MKILIVSFYYPPEIGAAPTRISNLALGLMAEGNNVDILTSLPNYPKGKIFDEYKGKIKFKEEVDGINIYRYWIYATVSKSGIKRALGMFSFAFMIWIFALKSKLIKKYDRVIVQSPPLPVAVSSLFLFKKIYKKKVIINISDLWPLSAVELGAMKNQGIIYKFFLWMEKFVYNNATAIMGQSLEILSHISTINSNINEFLYRNLKKIKLECNIKEKQFNLRIIYAGLLGVAQDILGIIKHINFKSINSELHIFGGGNQLEEIKEFIKYNPDRGVIYEGFKSPSELECKYKEFDVALVPLTVSIKGAVPSKLYDLLPIGIPVLFSGGGEGAEIVSKYNIGMISDPGDYKALESNIKFFEEMSQDIYSLYSKNCLLSSREDFNFDKQIKALNSFLLNL